MGTNYYAEVEKTSTCECCGAHKNVTELHVGKSSAGWCFSMHVHPEHGINNFNDWVVILKNATIRDEYHDSISFDRMIDIITKREGHRSFDNWSYDSRIFPYRDEQDFHNRNQSERGPNNLLRHRIGDFCVGHGEGTYDYIARDFS